MAWVPTASQNFNWYYYVPSLYSWNIAEHDIKQEPTNHKEDNDKLCFTDIDIVLKKENKQNLFCTKTLTSY